MSLINLFVAARSALARWRGIHRSQIPALIEGVHPTVGLDSEPDPIVASVFGCRPTRLDAGHRVLPPI